MNALCLRELGIEGSALISSNNKTLFGVKISRNHVSFNVVKMKLKKEEKTGTRIHAVMQSEVKGHETYHDDLRKSKGLFKVDVVCEEELKEKGFIGLRKTKLVCTIGPSCCLLEDLENMAKAGMNVARLNMCQNSREWHESVIRNIKKLNEEKGYCVSIMMDTEGSQNHVVDHGASSSIKAEDGSIWEFTTEKYEGCLPFTVQSKFEGFSEAIRVGDELVIDGGMAKFEVIGIGNNLRCKCTGPGLLLPRAKLSFWRDGKLVARNDVLPILLEKDWSDIEFGISKGVDFIAMSFVKNGHDVYHLKNYLSSISNSTKVLAKIESLESLQNLEEIVEASDGIMIARGDLGVEIPLEQIPSVQKDIVDICRRLNKPVIVASQLLESMIEYPIPTRAEVADVSEAVRQYADALMLSGESAIGAHCEKAVSVLCTTSTRMERWSRELNKQSALPHDKPGGSFPDQVAEQICDCAVQMADNLGLDAIFAFTRRGQMASLLSRNRPNSPIFAFTNYHSTRMALTLCWGVTPVLIELSDEVEQNLEKTIAMLKTKRMIKEGDCILVVTDIIPSDAAPTVFQSILVKTI
ncbi:kinase [Lithospermum erythrorhizon]|uniref:Pyruvate kinase n=1 Tax=Lithospermum erythrorhizon TaxID=34254 RepID=A0AAV3RQT0_LITER